VPDRARVLGPPDTIWAVRLALLLVSGCLFAQTGANVLVVVNGSDAGSREVGEYYRERRSIPAKNVCTLTTTTDEEIDWRIYEQQIERPVGDCLRRNGLIESVLYIATTLGVPLKVRGAGTGQNNESASVDSELALLYGKLKGSHFERAGMVQNPLYMRRDEAFLHPRFPIYLVTRLAAYDMAEVKAMIDRSLQAANRGKFVLDLNAADDESGNNWLRTAAILLPEGRIFLDDTKGVVTLQKDVIGYGSWGSNDPNRKIRNLGFQWLPGAIAAEFVSTSARTLKRPPDNWTYTNWNDRLHFWEGSPQGLAADLIHQGATGASGNTYEPFLAYCVRPDYLFPAYFQGRTLAESYYIATPALSWQGVVLGDPLCKLGKPQ
jgi:uncharacterized protein (TIGR03790 family)